MPKNIFFLNLKGDTMKQFGIVFYTLYAYYLGLKEMI